MKQRQLIERALTQCSEPAVSSLLVAFIRANETASCPKFDLTKITAKETNFYLYKFPGAVGVQHLNGTMTATNFAVVCRIAAEYNPELEGKIVDPKGNIIEGKFIEIDALIPDENTLIPVDFSYNESWNKYREGKILAKTERKELVITVKDCCGDSVEIYSDSYIHLLSFLKAFPKAKVYIPESKRVLFARGNDNILIVAPMSSDYARDGYLII